MHDARPSPVTIAAEGPRWRLDCSQWVPASPEAVFPFFSSVQNLERLTPAFLRFRILRAPTGPVHAGARIDYRLTLHGIPVWWRTRIEEWAPPDRFVDRQIWGPFRRWHHLHTFEAENGGTRLRDRVSFDVFGRTLYRTPVLGWIDDDLRRIFEFRRQEIATVFGPDPTDRRDGDEPA